METITLEIDGEEVEVEKGKTVLQAAKKAGIEIPSLCYYEKFENILETYGACRLCMVEVEKEDWSDTDIVASCGYPAEEGLQVKTRTPETEKIRKTMIELIAQRMSPKNVIGDIKKLAKEYGADLDRFEESEELDQCILCGRCVRCCEYQMSDVLTFVGRGTDREVVYDPGKLGACSGCSRCFEICPTGKLDSTRVDNNLRSIDDFFAGRE